ncbi:hypothetical protein XVE_4319, partial [Xanthomonas vesicatoria ATCC 35937]
SIDMMVSLGWAFPTKQVRRHTKDAKGAVVWCSEPGVRRLNFKVLCGMAGVGDIDSVLAALADPAQRAAVARMQRARWGGDGDVAGARSALREAFAKGPRWRHASAAEPEVLAPLYPPAP